MVRAIPFRTICEHCGVTLEYEKDDIQYGDVYYDEPNFIRCPVCGKRTEVK